MDINFRLFVIMEKVLNHHAEILYASLINEYIFYQMYDQIGYYNEIILYKISIYDFSKILWYRNELYKKTINKIENIHHPFQQKINMFQLLNEISWYATKI